MRIGQACLGCTVLVLASCGGSDSPTSPTSSSTSTITAITVSLSQDTLRVGGTATLTATASYSNGTSATISPEWTSSNTAVASVGKPNTVTAHEVGTTTITGSFLNHSGSTTLEVRAGLSAVEVVIEDEDRSLRVGDTTTVIAKAHYSDGVTEQVTPTWSSAEPGVATVSAAGTVTARAVGTTTIIATFSNQTGSVQITVTPPASLEHVVVRLGDTTLRVGETTQATAEARYSDGSRENVTATWSSKHPSVGTISSAGLVTAVAAGAGEIIGRYGGKTGYRKFTVTPLVPANLVWTTNQETGRGLDWNQAGWYRSYGRNSGSGCANNVSWHLQTYKSANRVDPLDDVTGSLGYSRKITPGERFTVEGNNLYKTGEYWASTYYYLTFTWTSISCSSSLLPHNASVGGQPPDENTDTQSSRPKERVESPHP